MSSLKTKKSKCNLISQTLKVYVRSKDLIETKLKFRDPLKKIESLGRRY